MPGTSLSQSALPDEGNGGNPQPPIPPGEVCLTHAEWQEVADCSMALHAAITRCEGLEGDEPAELVRSVEMRLDRAIAGISRRIFGD